MSQDLQRALNSFSDALSLADRQTLGTQTPTHDDVLSFTTHIDAIGSKKKMRSLGRRFQPFLEFIQQFSAIVETFIQSNTQIASLVWGGVKAVITVLSNYHDYFEKISEMFLKLGSVCPRLDRLQKLFPSSVALQEATCAFFATAVEFCTEVLKFLKSTSLKQLGRTIWKPFKSEFRDVESRLILQRDAIDLEVRIASESESRQERQEAALYRHRGDVHRMYEIKQWAGMKKRTEIQERRMQRETHLMNLSGYDYASVFLRNKEKRMGEDPKAASWFVEDKRFRGWVEGEESKAFWCHGIPGSGKSVLTTSVLDHLFESRTQETAICYFFCSYTEPESLEHQTIVASMTKQLLMVQDPWSNMVKDIVAGLFSGPIGKPVFSQIAVLLRALIEEQRKVFILLDGLDECASNVQHHLLSFLRDVLASRRTNTVKVYFASRTDLEVSKIVEKCVAYRLDNEPGRVDIRSFIARKLREAADMQQIVALSDSTWNEIKDCLEKGSEGMFLWVDFQIQDICLLDNEDDIRDLLRSLPRGLDETYNRILKRIGSEKLPEVALQIFRWVAGAKRPLTLEELAEAVALKPEFKSHSEARVSSDPLKMIRNCGNLVVLNELDKTVQFAHFTVKKYLTDASSTLKHSIQVDHINAPPFWQDSTWIDQKLGMVCVSYLTFSDFETQLIRRQDSNIALQNSMIEVANSGTWVPLVLGSNSVVGSLLSYASSWLPLRQPNPSQTLTYQFVPTKEKADGTHKLRSKYRMLDYILENWIWHCKYLEEVLEDDDQMVNRSARTFKRLIHGGGPSFLVRPWKAIYSKSEYDLGRYALDSGNEALFKIFYMEMDKEERSSFELRTFGPARENALQFACDSGHEDIAKYLLSMNFAERRSPGTLPSWILAARSKKYEISYHCLRIENKETPVDQRHSDLYDETRKSATGKELGEVFQSVLNEVQDDFHVQVTLMELKSYIENSKLKTGQNFGDHMEAAIKADQIRAVRRLLPGSGLSFRYEDSQLGSFVYLAATLERIEILKLLKEEFDADPITYGKGNPTIHERRALVTSFQRGAYSTVIPSLKAIGFQPDRLTVKMVITEYLAAAPETAGNRYDESQNNSDANYDKECLKGVSRINSLFESFVFSEFQSGAFMYALELASELVQPKRNLEDLLSSIKMPEGLPDDVEFMYQALVSGNPGAISFLISNGLGKTYDHRLLTAVSGSWEHWLLDCHDSAVERVLEYLLGLGIEGDVPLLRYMFYQAIHGNGYSEQFAELLQECGQDWRRALFTKMILYSPDDEANQTFFKRLQTVRRLQVWMNILQLKLPQAEAEAKFNSLNWDVGEDIIEFYELFHKSVEEFAVANVSCPMLLACKFNHFEIADRLLEFGADPNEGDDIIGGTCLIWAIKHRNWEFAKRLLYSKKKADLNARAWKGRTALHYCANALWLEGCGDVWFPDSPPPPLQVELRDDECRQPLDVSEGLKELNSRAEGSEYLDPRKVELDKGYEVYKALYKDAKDFESVLFGY